MPDATPPTSPTPIDETRTVRPLEYGSLSKRSVVVDKVIDAIKTLAWVMPLTLLIWIYAERKQSATRSNVSFPVEVRINSKDRMVVLRDPPDHNLFATLTGPQANLQRVIDTIQAPLPGDRAVLQINVNPKATSGDLTLDPKDALRTNPIFAQNGVSVRDVIPGGIRVTVMDMEERIVPVRAPDGVKNLANPRFVPAEVTVRAPRNVLKEAADNNRLYVIADIGKVEALNQSGRHEVPSVAVTTGFPSEYATIEPKIVTASFEVNRPDAEITIDSVPVWPAGSTPFLARYKVECKTLSIPGVHIVGPQDQIDKLKSGLPVVALLYVTPDDLRNGETHRKLVRWDIPDGCKVTGDPELYTVTFSLVERPQQD